MLKITILTILLVVLGKHSFSQDTSKFNVGLITILENFPIETSIYHFPKNEDSIICDKYFNLISSEPTEENYSNFYALACSLWELSMLPQAEKMFLKIISSKAPYYENTYYNSSDIPGDTTTNTYGYGSFTFNFKNFSSRYLTKIYIEKQEFEKALKYIEFADKKYIVTYNCGTGHRSYRREIEGLYCSCYEGLGKYDSIINMFLPDYSKWNKQLIRAIKNVYTDSQINSNLIIAQKSIVFLVDTFQSSTYTTYNFGKKDEYIIETKYTSGKASVILFGREIGLWPPTLENGEIVTKELFLKEFKESYFYRALIN